jgi:hypothetical protein
MQVLKCDDTDALTGEFQCNGIFKECMRVSSTDDEHLITAELAAML